MRKSVKYSQNFLTTKELAIKLINKSSITEDDVVLEIGAGEGLITNQLSNRSKKVIAYEIDKILYTKLKQSAVKNVKLISGDFLEHELPKGKYKVFSNPPFNSTSDIVKKLLFSNNPPLDTYLIVQKEAARKFTGTPYGSKNSLLATLLKVQYKSTMFYRFERSDFHPAPSVDIVMIRIEKLGNPLVNSSDVEHQKLNKKIGLSNLRRSGTNM